MMLNVLKTKKQKNLKMNKKEGLRIIQHNCRRSTNIMQSMLNSALNKTEIIFLQEPWVSKENNTITHPGFQPIITNLKEKRKNRIRVLTFISKNIPFEISNREDLINDEDCQIIDLKSKEFGEIRIFNIYNERRQNTQNGEYTVNRLYNKINLHCTKKTLLIGDFNAHHSLWNPGIKVNLRSEKIIELIENKNLQLINRKGIATHYYARKNKTGSSIIDLSFATFNLKELITSWRIDEEMDTGSDHEVISIKIKPNNNNLVDNPTSTNKFNWNKTDWDKFKKELLNLDKNLDENNLWDDLINSYIVRRRDLEDNLEKATSLFQRNIILAVERSTPILKITPRSKIWWNEKIEETRKEMLRQKRVWKLNRSQKEWETFKTKRNKHFKEIRSAKEKSWVDFLENAKDKEIFLALNFSKPRKIQKMPNLEFENNTASNFQEKAGLLRKALFPPPPSYQEDNTNLGFVEKVINKKLITWKKIKNREIREAIFTSNSKKAPGPDGINFLCLKRAYEIIPERFNNLFSKLLNNGYHPICFREAVGAILPKPNKPDYNIPKAYRIISLLNCLGKISEKIIARRIAFLSETNKILNPEQIGGRKQRSAIDAALALVHDIEIADSKKLKTSVLFLDVKGAFDNVSKERLINTLKDMKFPEQLIGWVKDFMSKRLIKLSFDGQIEKLKPVKTGIPQGSPISPILFLLYLTPLFNELERKMPSIKKPSYIDDLALVSTNKKVEQNIKELETAAKIAFNWAKNNAVAFDDIKSELIHFKTKNKNKNKDKNGGIVVLPNGTKIKPSETIRWLGIHLDVELKFKDHIKIKTNAANKIFNFIRALANSEKGLKTKALIQLYKSCVCSVSDYGSEIWWKNQNQQNILKEFKLIQNKMLRKITGAFKTTPIHLLEVEASILPPEIRLNGIQRRYALRSLYLNKNHPIKIRTPESFPPEFCFGREDENEDLYLNWNENKKEEEKKEYISTLDRILSRINFLINPYTKVEEISIILDPPWVENKIEININSIPKDLEAENHKNKKESLNSKENLLIYTDGSMLEIKNNNKNKKSTGAGIYGEIDNEPIFEIYHSLGKNMEVYDAELIALREGFIKSLEISNKNNLVKNIYFFTDNQAAIKRLESLKIGAGQEIASEIWEIAGELTSRNINLFIEWVPGHSDVKGNERADFLAKEAAKQKQKSPYKSFAFLKRKTKEKDLIEWEEKYKKNIKRANYNNWPKLKRNKNFAKFSNKFVSALTQLRTGHGYFNNYLIRIPNSGVLNKNCLCRNTPQTPKHLIMECQFYKKEREVLKEELKSKNKKQFDYNYLLFNKDGMILLEKFLNKTNIAQRSNKNQKDSLLIGWGNLEI